MKKTVLITGANSGIGKEATIQLLQNGCHVIACCRNKEKVEKAYYQSKLAQIMYTYWLSEKLKEQNICVNSVWVTNVKIDISRYPNLTDFQKKLYNMKSKFSIAASEMAKTYVAIALSDSFKDITGKVVDKDLKFINTNSYSKNKENIDRLMNLTYQYLKNK